MAGIGVRLNRIFEKNTLTTNMIGFFYSTLVTVAPMFAIIINLVLMEYFLKFSTLGYAQRELFSCTILYTFIFSLLTASPFNAVLSRYMSDIIYEERYQDILPCYHIGMVLNIALSKMKIKTGDVFLAARLKRMIEKEEMEMQGNWDKGWKEIEIRLHQIHN